MELKFLSVNLNTVNQVLSEKQIAKIIELQNNLIKWEIENKKFLCDQETLSPLSTDITELLDKLRLKYPLLPTIPPYPTMRLETIRSIIPISCSRHPKSVWNTSA
jgi:hypothetical protein